MTEISRTRRGTAIGFMLGILLWSGVVERSAHGREDTVPAPPAAAAATPAIQSPATPAEAAPPETVATPAVESPVTPAEAAPPEAGPPAFSAEPAVPPPFVPPPATPGRPLAAYVVVGLAGASAVVGAILGIQALREKQDFDRGDRTLEKVDAIERTALLADMAFGAALALGVTGVVLWYSNLPSSELASEASPHRPAVVLAPLLSPAGPGAEASFQF